LGDKLFLSQSNSIYNFDKNSILIVTSKHITLDFDSCNCEACLVIAPLLHCIWLCILELLLTWLILGDFEQSSNCFFAASVNRSNIKTPRIFHRYYILNRELRKLERGLLIVILFSGERKSRWLFWAGSFDATAGAEMATHGGQVSILPINFHLIVKRAQKRKLFHTHGRINHKFFTNKKSDSKDLDLALSIKIWLLKFCHQLLSEIWKLPSCTGDVQDDSSKISGKHRMSQIFGKWLQFLALVTLTIKTFLKVW